MEEPEPPKGALAAELCLGPFASIEAACDAFLLDCDPRYTECSCSGPRADQEPGWMRITGLASSDPGGENDEDVSVRVVLRAKSGLWVSRHGVRAGEMWALNGDGYWEHAIRSSSLRTTGSSQLFGEARVETHTCFCCRSAHPNCRGVKPMRTADVTIDYALQCRRDARGRPWCVVVAAERGFTMKGAPLVRFLDDEVEEARWWSDAGPSRREVWFPPEE